MLCYDTIFLVDFIFIKVDLQWGQFKSRERKYKTFTSVDYGIQAYPP